MWFSIVLTLTSRDSKLASSVDELVPGASMLAGEVNHEHA